MAAALLSARGQTVLVDHVFEARFGCAGGFEAMGAAVSVRGRTLHIHGGRPLHGADVTAGDLRGGAALVVAALVVAALVVAALGTRGSSRIAGREYIARGYGGLEEMLRSLGARIE